MMGASLLFCVLLGQSPAGSPVALVSRLGAPRYADREEASAALERLGREALPALRVARGQKDPEVRTRAASLIVKIEGSLLTRATQVSLAFENAPLPEVIKSVSEQTGIKLTLVPENSSVWRTRRLTLREPSPLPFWTAIDRVCEAGHLQYNYGMHLQGGREPTFPLFEGAGRPPMPVSDSGPFRVSVVGLHFQRDVNFANAPQLVRVVPGQGRPSQPSASINDQFYAQLQVTGEPRLALSMAGQIRVLEAVDDKDQNLALPTGASGPTGTRMSAYFGFATGPVVQVQAAMARPVQPGAVIKKLKGVIPVNVSTRKPNPLTIPLAGAAGRTFQNEDVAVTVVEVRDQANNRPSSIDLTIRPTNSSTAGAGPNEVASRPDSHLQQIDVFDAQGRLMPWYQSGFDAEAGRLTMAFPNQDPGVKAAEVRYYGVIRASAEVPFEFGDLPLP
jgi:hypothetical protein